MKVLRAGYGNVEYKFEDSDPDYDCFKRLLELKEKETLTQDDFDIITSMFELHKDLPSIVEVLFKQGFILPENKVLNGNQKASWKNETIQKFSQESPRFLEYTTTDHYTDWNRSDNYRVDIKYFKGDFTAIYEYRDLSRNYGADKECYKQCFIKIKDEMLVEYKKNFDVSHLR